MECASRLGLEQADRDPVSFPPFPTLPPPPDRLEWPQADATEAAPKNAANSDFSAMGPRGVMLELPLEPLGPPVAPLLEPPKPAFEFQEALFPATGLAWLPTRLGQALAITSLHACCLWVLRSRS